MPDVDDGGLRFVRAEPIDTATFFDIENLHYVDSGGRPVVRSVVRHPGAVVVVPLLDDAVVMIRQFRVAAGRPLLELPAGKLDVAGEPLEEAARRECEEEIGYRPGRLRHLSAFWNSPGFTDEHTTVFLATDLEPVARAPHGPEEETSEVVVLPVDEIVDLLDSGGIDDGKSLIGLLAYLRSKP